MFPARAQMKSSKRSLTRRKDAFRLLLQNLRLIELDAIRERMFKMNKISKIVKDYAKQHEVTSILERIEILETFPEVKIGFLGEFSSGKTSLLNALLGCNLPVNINPTTKAVCLLEAKEGISSSTYALEDHEGFRSEVDFIEFSDIVAGETVGASVAVVQLPASETFKQGMVFVDTPGVNSLNQVEEDVTYRYLSHMDAAIVCLPVEKGTITQSIINFITDARLKHLIPNMYFVITKIDQKNAKDVDLVKQNIIAKLNTLPVFATNAMAEKVLTFTKDPGYTAVSEMRTFIEKHLVGNLPKLMQMRKATEMKNIAQDLLEALEEKRKLMDFDNSALDKEISALQKDLENLERLQSQKESEFINATERLSTLLRNTMESYHGPITAKSVKGESTSDDFRQMAQRINSILDCEITKLISDFDVSNLKLSEYEFTRLQNQLETYHTRRDVASTTITSIVLTAVFPGAGVAGNAAEFVAATGAKKAVDVAAKKGGFLKTLGGVVKEANLIDQIAALGESTFSNKLFHDEIQAIAASLSERIIKQTKDVYCTQVIEPIKEKIREKERCICSLREEKGKLLDDFIALKENLSNDIKALKKLL